MKLGRRNLDRIDAGDFIDWWLVERFEAGRRLRLFSRMKVPGSAWLEFEVEPNAGGSLIRQTARFRPKSLMGRMYWYALLPVHALVFSGLLRELARAALKEQASDIGPGQEAGWDSPAKGEYQSGSD